MQKKEDQGTLPGNIQKLNVFQAGLNAPGVILLDEPFVFLDLLIKNEVKAMIQGMKNRENIIMISSHNLEDVVQLCDHLAFLHEGRIAGFIDKQSLQSRFYTATFRVGNNGNPLDSLKDEPGIRAVHLETVDGMEKIVMEKTGDGGFPGDSAIRSRDPGFQGKTPSTIEDIYRYFIR